MATRDVSRCSSKSDGWNSEMRSSLSSWRGALAHHEVTRLQPAHQRPSCSRALSLYPPELVRVLCLLLDHADTSPCRARTLSRARCADEEATVGELTAELISLSEGEVSEADIIERLRHLYHLRLISFRSSAD